MEASIIPCAFTLSYMCRNYDKGKEVTDTAIHSVLYAIFIAFVGHYISSHIAWALTLPPLVLLMFFHVYQHARSGQRESLVPRLDLISWKKKDGAK